MYIMTERGWKPLQAKTVAGPTHVPSILESMGIDANYDGVAAMANYANSTGRGYYFHYNQDGTYTQQDTQTS